MSFVFFETPFGVRRYKYTNLLTADKTDTITVASSWTAQSETVLKKVYTYSFNLAFSGISVQSG